MLQPPSFGHAALVERIVEKLVASLQPGAGSSAEPALVVGVFGEWGAGKSRLLQHIGDDLPRGDGEQTLTVVVPFNAWRYEREEHLLVPLLRVAQQCLRKALENSLGTDIHRNETLSDRLSLLGDLAQTVYQHGGRELLQTALATHGAVFKLPELKTEAGKAPPSAWARWRQHREALKQARRLTLPADSLSSLYYDFLEHLKAVTGRNPKALALHRDRLKYRGLGWWPQLKWQVLARLSWLGTGELPADADFQLNLVFLVDDLDRCLPDKAVEVLEAIKLFLEVDGCAFVLALDEEVIERGIAHRYRDYALQGREGMTPITGAEYLEKLVHLPVRLPRPSRAETEDFLAAHPTALFGSGEPNALAQLVAAITPPVPRKLHRMVDLLNMGDQLASQTAGAASERLEWLAVGCALQLFAPALYRYLRMRGPQLLLTLAEWRADAQLRDLDALRDRLAREVREVTSPAELNYRLALQRLPDLCMAAMQNRSGFDLLELLARVSDLQARAPLHPTELGALLAFTEAKADASGAATVARPPAASPPGTPELPTAIVEPLAHPGTPIAAPAAKAAPQDAAAGSTEPLPEARLENAAGLLEALVSGKPELLRFTLSREGEALRDRFLPDSLWARLLESPWLANLQAWVAEGMPPGATEQMLRDLRPHLTQAMALSLMELLGPALNAVLRRPSWAARIDTTATGRVLAPPLHESGGTWLNTRDLVAANGWAVPRGWDCHTDTVLEHPVDGGLTTLRLGADPRHGVFALLTLNRDGDARPVTQRLRWIEPGVFLMGSPQGEPGRPQHEPLPATVHVDSGFWMADTPCTRAFWRAVMGLPPPAGWNADEDQLPATGLAPAEALEFLRRLDRLLPSGDARLPREAEWEYACRAGATTPWHFGSGFDPELVQAGASAPVPVTRRPPNAWGLHEMHGNVDEICLALPLTTSVSSKTDLPGPFSLRGGAWDAVPQDTRAAASRPVMLTHAMQGAGLRFTLRARTPAPQPPS